MEITIRTLTPDDAEELLRLSLRLDQETAYMLYEPGERKTTVEQQRSRLTAIHESEHSTFIGAFDQEQLVGFIAGNGSSLKRVRHSLYIVIGILQQYSGQGIGKKLFRELEAWARAHGIHRIELTVMAHNEPAVKLYTAMGFEIEGTKKHSLILNGAYIDEYYMAKILEN